MKIDVALRAEEIPETAGSLHDLIVVIDTLRATSTLLQALLNGAESVTFFENPQQVLEATASALTRGDPPPLRCGERDCVMIDGFDLGNSPLDYQPEVVRNRQLFLTTSNGSRAVTRAGGGAEIVGACLRNRTVVSRYIAETVAETGKVLIVCSGTLGEVSPEDSLTAGSIVARLIDMNVTGQRDLAETAVRLTEEFRDVEHDVLGAVRRSPHAERLRASGFDDDVTFCAALDAESTGVPVGTARGSFRLADPAG